MAHHTSPATAVHPAPAAAGESNPVNRACALCGTPTGGTGLICASCAVLPAPAAR